MKSSRSENLSEHLTCVDEEFLVRAYEIDDGEKLRQYIREKLKKPFFKTVGFRRASVVAACLLLIFGCLLAAPAFFFRAYSKAQENGSSSDKAPPCNGTQEALRISSLDMLNYYAAMMALDGGSAENALSAVDPFGDTERIYGYALDPDAVFSVSRAVFFQVEIKNADGFLASRIGTGIADVVITENSLAPMITFKNGDRYYSCCESDGGLYSTQKYIDGFYIVRNSAQEIYSFRVVYENGYENTSAARVICASENGGATPDGELAVVGKTCVSAEGGVYTVREIEAYFAQKLSQ